MHLSLKVSSKVLLPVRMEWKNLFLFKLNKVPWGASETSCNFGFPRGPGFTDPGEKGDPETTTATRLDNELP